MLLLRRKKNSLIGISAFLKKLMELIKE